MKKNFSKRFKDCTAKVVNILLVSVFVFTGCVKELDITEPDNSFGDTEDVNLSDIQVIDQGEKSWKEHYMELLQEAESENSPEGDMMAEYAREQLNNVIEEEEKLRSRGLTRGTDGEDGTNYTLGYKWTSIRYKSVDENNQPIHLSQLVAWPYNNKSANPKLRNLIIGCHVTITSNHERPSNYEKLSILSDIGMLVGHARSTTTIGYNALVVIPDYQGYGSSSHTNHPYLYRELTARQVYDGAQAAKAWCEQNETVMDEDWSSIAVGYSQGGAVAMSVHRFIEENKKSNSIRFKGSVCADGPYDPLTTLKSYISDGKVYMPVSLAFMLKSMCDSNPLLKGKYTPKDFLNEKFLASGILDWIESKNYSTDEIQKKIINYSGTNKNGFIMKRKVKKGFFVDPVYEDYTADNIEAYKKDWDWLNVESDNTYAEINQILKQDAIDYFSGRETGGTEKYAVLEAALEMNDVTKGWHPQLPMYVFHSTRDEVVPFSNYQSASKNFSSTGNFLGVQYATDAYLHLATGASFYFWYEISYVRKILENNWKKDIGDKWQTGGMW